MKYKTMVALSIIILVFCLHPVISAELDENGNDTKLAADDDGLNDSYEPCVKSPHLHIDSDDVFNVGDKLSFKISYDYRFDKPVTLYLDGEYWTTVDGYVESFIIKIGNSQLSPGKHTISARYDGAGEWFHDSYTKEFFINGSSMGNGSET